MYSAIANAINHPDAINPYQAMFNHRMLRSLSDAGVDLDVISPRPHAPPVGPYSEYASIPKTEDWGAYAVHHPRFWYLLPKRLLYGLSGRSYANRIPAYVHNQFDPPDVVQGCHIYPDGYGMLPYVRRHDIPLFVVAHGKLLNDIDSLAPTVGEKVKETLDAATGVLCVSDSLASKAARYTDPASVHTVPIGADPENFPVDQQSRLRRELDIDAEATVVLFVGTFTERKGIDEIRKALPAIDSEDTVFVFIGPGGPKEQELKQAVAESEFSNRYIYTGVTSLGLRRWYAVADLLLLPSHAEGRPTVIYEAMASETAVLASNVDGVPEQVRDGETGVLLPPGDVDALEQELNTLVGNRQKLQEMGKAGVGRLRSKSWTWSDHSDRVRTIHQAAIE